MRRTYSIVSAILGLLSLLALAQPARAAQSTAPIGVTLGHSTITLAGPWKFAPGDSPQINGSFVWASPAFNDATWANMDLHSAGGVDASYGYPGYVPGWTARGFPDLSGFAWYRLRVHVNKAAGPLWLKMPDHVDDAYQIFASNHFIGGFGHFTSKGIVCYLSRPLIFPLPAPDEHGNLLLAIRFFMEPGVLVQGNSGSSGGMHQAPVLGLHESIESMLARADTGRILVFIVPIFVSFLLLIAAFGAFWIYVLDRPHQTYLWLTLALILTAASPAALTASVFSLAFTQDVAVVFIEGFAVSGFACWIFFWRKWFDLAPSRRAEIPIFIVAAADILMVAVVYLSPKHLSAHPILIASQMEAALDAVLGFLILVALFQGARKDRVGAWIALPPIVLLVVNQFSEPLLLWFGVRTSFFPFGVKIGIDDVALFLMLLVVGALVVRRFLNSQVNQRLARQAVEQELEQARELQQHVLVPEPITSSLFSVETAYHPARTVGGDFFQVIPHADGSLLIVVGDVSGKGMAAAMLVAVLVGAIRTRADETFDPAAILRSLNDRLLGRSGGHFATCIAAHLRPGGAMLIANAGHLPPYRNGVALDLPGALPLGIAAEAEYDIHAILLDLGDRLTFLTDGVLEARNPAGQLLGFDQLAEISSLSPETIAQAAISHGQEDDITVVGIRLSAMETSAAYRVPEASEVI